MKSITTEIQKHNNVTNVTSLLTPAEAQQLPSLAAPSPSTEALELSRWRSFAVESMKRKQRADSFFHSLTTEQQDKLLHWLEEEEDLGTVCMRISAPQPEGFGLNVHLTSLRRFRAHWKSLNHIMLNEEILDSIHDMETNSDFSQRNRIQEAISQMLHEKAFQLARTHPGSDTVTRLLTSIEKLAALDYKRQKLLLEREKLLLNARHSPGSPKHHRVDLNIVRPAEPPAHPTPSLEASLS